MLPRTGRFLTCFPKKYACSVCGHNSKFILLMLVWECILILKVAIYLARFAYELSAKTKNSSDRRLIHQDHQRIKGKGGDNVYISCLGEKLWLGRLLPNKKMSTLEKELIESCHLASLKFEVSEDNTRLLTFVNTDAFGFQQMFSARSG